MAKPKSNKAIKRPSPLAELGAGNFALDFNKSTGRPLRKCRSRATDSPLFEDSAIAISDPESEDYEEREVGDSIAVASRKRKRSPSPPEIHLPSEDAEMSSSDSEAELANTEVSPAPRSSMPPGQMTLHLTVNIPLGHQGPVTLQLDPSNITSIGGTKPDAITRSNAARLSTRSKSTQKKRTYAGFLDLPAELRNEIYRSILVSDKSVNFSNPENFSRSGQLLQTCRQVYEEGRSILYSENTFAIERRTQRYGSLWATNWRELGYLTVRKFMKSIGPSNIGLIRNVSFMLEDAVPCLNPKTMSNEERRFVNDDDLMSVLRHLGSHAQLQKLSIHFHGRRKVERTDDRLLSNMKRIKADEVAFASWPPESINYSRDSKQDHAVKDMLLTACTRRKKRFD